MSAPLLHVACPNPSVVCQVSHHSKNWIGYTQPRGGAHAEIMALAAAAKEGVELRGATVQVSLEPCSHHGLTPPCTQALIAAGVAKVVIDVLDPNPLVAGLGVQQLREAGIEVQVLPKDHPQAIASREHNIGFFSRMIRQTPWVRMKMAASLDGVTALHNGQSQWITSPEARDDGHRWRAQACAVLTGIGTVRQDDPQLNVRALIDTPTGSIPAPRQPHVVLIDSQLEISLEAKLLQTIGQRGKPSALYPLETIQAIAPRAIFIYHASQNQEKIKALQALGAKLVYLPQADGAKVDLIAMMRDLALNQEINELHVEAGFKLNGSLLRAGVVDEMLIYLAPALLGAGMGIANLPQLESLAALPDSQKLVFRSAQMLGTESDQAQQRDLRIIARIRGRDAFLAQA